MKREDALEAAYAVLNALDTTRSKSKLRGPNTVKELEQFFADQLNRRVPGLSDSICLAMTGSRLVPLARDTDGAMIMRRVVEHLKVLEAK